MAQQIIPMDQAFLNLGSKIHHDLLGTQLILSWCEEKDYDLERTREALRSVLEDIQKLLSLSEAWSTISNRAYRDRNETIDNKILLLEIEKFDPIFNKLCQKSEQKFSIEVENLAELSGKIAAPHRALRALLTCLFKCSQYFADYRGAVKIRISYIEKELAIHFFAEQNHTLKSVFHKPISNFEDETEIYPTILIFRKFLMSLIESIQFPFSEEINGPKYAAKLVLPVVIEEGS